jgi:hypothetical protein
MNKFSFKYLWIEHRKQCGSKIEFLRLRIHMVISICASKKRKSICCSNNEILWLEINLVTRACGCSISYFPSHQKQPRRLPFIYFHRPSFLLPFYVSFFPSTFRSWDRVKRAVPPFFLAWQRQFISHGGCSLPPLQVHRVFGGGGTGFHPAPIIHSTPPATLLPIPGLFGLFDGCDSPLTV